MNFNVSPIAFYPSRAAQPWRAWYYQRKIAVVTGDSLLPFLINDTPATAPDTVEIYEPNTDTLVSTRTGVSDILAHVSTVDGQSVTSWIYQGTSAGIFGFTTAGYYYLKIGNYYSDIIKFGAVEGDFVQLEWQTFDDIITVDGTLLSKYIKHKLIFETDLWHPTYEVKEEGKENNGIYYQTSRTLTKTSGFSAIVNEAVLDSLYSIGNGDKVTIEARRNGVLFSYETNRVEVKNTVQSDDVESVQVEFDLFSIIRKYQKSENAPEPLPIPTPPVPPSNYTISGTTESGVNSVKFLINGTSTTISVVNRAFSYAYDDALTSFKTDTSDANTKKITTLDLSASCLLSTCTAVSFDGLEACTEIEGMGYLELPAATNIDYIFRNCKKLTSIYLNGRMENLTSAKAICDGCANLVEFWCNGVFANITNTDYWFRNCTKQITNWGMNNATFASVTSAVGMFYNCNRVYGLPAATFAAVDDMSKFYYGIGVSGMYRLKFSDNIANFAGQPLNVSEMFSNVKYQVIMTDGLDLTAIEDCNQMFSNCTLTTEISLNSTFDSATGVDASGMFRQCSKLATLSDRTFEGVDNASYMFTNAFVDNANVKLTSATFENATNVSSMFVNCKMKKLELPAATFAAATSVTSMFSSCTNLETLDISAGTFAYIGNANYMFSGCTALKNLTVGSGSTMPKSFNIPSAVLTKASAFALKSWIASVGTAQTITLNNSVLVQMQADAINYATFVATLTTKNWTVQS